jgi:hypothetical protein
MKMKNICSLLVVLLILVFQSSVISACERGSWLQNKITELKSQPVANPPAKIIQQRFEGKLYYYLPAKCCDMYSSLYTADGDFVCSPDGGFAGIGDGKCPDFVRQMEGEKVVWQDMR